MIREFQVRFSPSKLQHFMAFLRTPKGSYGITLKAATAVFSKSFSTDLSKNA
jgi:hypothetical protein